jgi:DNA invertase Pin-like site-specific DNA recombinase
MKAAIYARVSTFDHEPENQLARLCRYVDARGRAARSHVDTNAPGFMPSCTD